MSGHNITTEDWGRTIYADAYTRQEALLMRRIAGEVGDTLVFTEHDPVFTIGMHSGAEGNLVWDAPMLDREGISIAKTNRGGDITYHGPGQIVGYPIVDLSARKDLHAYLRFMEDVLIVTVAHFGLTADRREGKTGIWIETRKIAAIGVAVKRWVAWHGFALNVNTDLKHFNGIVPCGIQSTDGTVTSLQSELGHEVDLNLVKEQLALHFRRLWPKFLHNTTDSTPTMA